MQNHKPKQYRGRFLQAFMLGRAVYSNFDFGESRVRKWVVGELWINRDGCPSPASLTNWYLYMTVIFRKTVKITKPTTKHAFLVLNNRNQKEAIWWSKLNSHQLCTYGHNHRYCHLQCQSVNRFECHYFLLIYCLYKSCTGRLLWETMMQKVVIANGSVSR